MVRPPPPPPIVNDCPSSVVMVCPPSERLDALPMNVSWSFGLYVEAIDLTLNSRPRSSRSSLSEKSSVVPPLAATLPNHPFSYSFLSATSTSLVRLPSAMPVTRSSSDFLSITRILSTIEAGRLFSAIDWSSKKKVLPLTVMRLTSSPLTRTLPFSEMSMPGIRVSRSLSTAFLS